MNKKTFLIIIALILAIFFVMGPSVAAEDDNVGVVGGSITLTFSMDITEYNEGNLIYLAQKDGSPIITFGRWGDPTGPFEDRVTLEKITDTDPVIINIIIHNITKDDIGIYQMSCKKHNGQSVSGISPPINISEIYNRAEIDVSPTDVIVFEGPASFSVDLGFEDEDITYHWYKSVNKISTIEEAKNALYEKEDTTTDPTYTFDANFTDDGHWYKVVVYVGPESLNNTAESDPAQLTVLKTPEFKENPIQIDISSEDNEAILYVDERLKNHDPLYVLKKEINDEYEVVAEKIQRLIENGMDDILTIKADINSAGSYRVVGTLRDGTEIASQPIELKVVEKIGVSITIDPMVTEVFTGETIKINATPSGTIPTNAIVSYQLYANGAENGTPNSDGKFVPDTTAAGDYTYYVEMTVAYTDGTSITVKSNTVDLKIHAIPTVAIAIDNNPVFVGGTANITATPTVLTGQTPTYQWFTGTPGTGTTIQDATGATYLLPTTAAGTTEYYVEMTVNYAGEKTVTSSSVEFTVYDVPTVAIAIDNNPVFVGGAANITATPTVLTGQTPTYQWFKGTPGLGTLISGATGATYLLPTTAAGATEYYVEMTVNYAGEKTVTSSSVEFTVYDVPTVAIAIDNNPVFVGGAANITATPTVLTGQTPTYQWFKGTPGLGTLISGATGATYLLPTTAAGATEYYVEMTVNYAGEKTVTSSSVEFTVYDVPTVAIAIDNNPVFVGGAANITATPTVLTGQTPTYQWFKGTPGLGTLISGATGATYLLPTTAAGATEYYVEMTVNYAGEKTVTSSSVEFTVYDVPTVAIAIDNNPVFVGGAANITATPTVLTGQTPTYQWFKGTPGLGTLISGATGATYLLPATAAGTTEYYVEMTVNYAGEKTVTSSSVEFTVYENPTIEADQSDKYAFIGRDVTLSVTTTPDPNLPETATVIQWFGPNGDPIQTDAKYLISSNGKELKIIGVSSTDAGEYSATITSTLDDETVSSNGTKINLTVLELTVSPSATVTAGDDVTFEINGMPIDNDWTFAWFENGTGLPDDLEMLKIQNIEASRNNSEFHVEIIANDETLKSNKITLTVEEIVNPDSGNNPSGGTGEAKIIDNSGTGFSNSGGTVIQTPEDTGEGFEITDPIEDKVEKTRIPWLWILLLLLIIIAVIGYVVWKKKSNGNEKQ